MSEGIEEMKEEHKAEMARINKKFSDYMLGIETITVHKNRIHRFGEYNEGDLVDVKLDAMVIEDINGDIVTLSKRIQHD